MMKDELKIRDDGVRAVEIYREEGGLLLRYVYRPETALEEATRPFAHPVRTLAGEVLTNFRPNDHPWHHGLNFTIGCLSGHNFWGGVTYRKEDGYQWRGDHGTQRHTGWLEQGPNYLAHTLEWRVGAAGEVLLRENRALTLAVLSPKEWSLRWASALKNVSGRMLELGQYRSNQELAGSHYGGLQFRGARDLLDDHGDAAIGIFAEGGLSGEKEVHGSATHWMEWRGQKDGSQRRVRLRFANNDGPRHWFVRRHNPLAAIPFQYDRDLSFVPGATLAIDHTLTFTDS